MRDCGRRCPSSTSRMATAYVPRSRRSPGVHCQRPHQELVLCRQNTGLYIYLAISLCTGVPNQHDLHQHDIISAEHHDEKIQHQIDGQLMRTTQDQAHTGSGVGCVSAASALRVMHGGVCLMHGLHMMICGVAMRQTCMSCFIR